MSALQRFAPRRSWILLGFVVLSLGACVFAWLRHRDNTIGGIG